MSGDPAMAKMQTRALFDRLASDYDVAGPGCFAYFGQRLVAAVGIEPGQRVLDVATGRGAVLFPAAEGVGPEGEAIGIDLADEMVRLLRDEVEGRGLAAEVRVMDAEQLTFPDRHFDRVFCGFGAMFFPDLARTLGEFRRVLKPGGRLGISTWRVSQTAAIEAVLAQLGIVDLSTTPALRFNSPATLEQPLVAADFDDVRVTSDETSFRFADAEQYWQNARGTGLRRWLDGFDAEQTARVKAALADQLRRYRREDGYHVPATALLAVAGR